MSPAGVEHRTMLGAAVLLLIVHMAGSAAMISTTSDRTPSADPPTIALRIDPNTATIHELQLLPRIGPKLAAAIIEYRATHEAPVFTRVEDLQAVRRIGPRISAGLRPYVSFATQTDTPHEDDIP